MLTQTKILTIVIILLMLLATACGAQPAGTGAEAEPETEVETAGDVVAEEEAAETEEAEAQDDASHDEEMEAAHEEEAEEHNEDAPAHDEEAEEHSEDEHEHDEKAQAHDEDDHEQDEAAHADEEEHEHDAAVELSAVDLAEGEKLQVVATTNIVGDLVRNVAGDMIDLTTMLPIGADPHTFEPAPQDVTVVADADVVFVNGLGLEEFLADLIENAGGDAPTVALSTNVETREFEAGEGHGHGEEDEHHEDEGEHHDEEGEHHEEEGEHHDEEGEHHDEEGEHHDEEEGEHHDEEGEHHDEEGEHHDEEGEHHDEEEGEHHHDHDGADPHIWMTPANAVEMVHNIEHALSELDPANAETYEANAAAYEAELEALDAWVMEQIAAIPEENREMVTDHDAFGYYANRYGLEVVGAVIPNYSTNAEPSAQELAALQDAVGEYSVQAVFVGTTVNPVLAEQLATDSGIELVPLYTGSLGEAGSGVESYIDLMRYNTEAIVEALQPGS